VSHIGKAGAFALLCVACLTIMVGCVIVPGLPEVAAGLGVPHASSWLVTLPSAGVVVFGAAAGRAMTRLGAYRTLVWGLVLYGALGLAGMWLYQPVLLFADRFLLGGATALVMSSGTALLSEFYSGAARLRMIARQGMAIELGGVIFLAIGGVLARLGWQFPFLLYLAAWVFLALVLAFVPSEAPAPEDEDAARQPRHAATSGPVWDVFAAACLSQLVFFTAVVFMPARLAALGLSVDEAGYFMAFISLVAVCAAAVMPRLQTRLGGWLTLAAAFACYALSHLLYTTGVLPLMILGAVLMGAGFGWSIPLVNHLVVERSPVARRKHNLGFLSMAIFLGQFLSSFMQFVSHDPTSAFGAAGVAAAVVAVLFLAAGLWSRRRADARRHGRDVHA